MIIANSHPTRTRGIIVKYQVLNWRVEINRCSMSRKISYIFPKISQVSRFSAKSPDSRNNFFPETAFFSVVIPRQQKGAFLSSGANVVIVSLPPSSTCLKVILKRSYVFV